MLSVSDIRGREYLVLPLLGPDLGTLQGVDLPFVAVSTMVNLVFSVSSSTVINQTILH